MSIIKVMDQLFKKEVSISIADTQLAGELIIPRNAQGIVIFSHGSGSSRFSSRNLQVARFLHQRNLGTLLFDLLTKEEDLHYQNRFDIDLLTRRLIGATAWLQAQPEASHLPLGYFGASTGAASALKAASRSSAISAVVSRGGRPDLAIVDLPGVKAPTLLIVGGLDTDVIQMNKAALMRLGCEKKLEIVPGASHLFEEQGTMEKVSELASAWFEKYLQPVKMGAYYRSIG